MAQITIRAMGRMGDVATVIDTESADAVAEAEQIIADHIGVKKGTAFARYTRGDVPTQIDVFDPEAETIFLVVPFQGG